MAVKKETAQQAAEAATQDDKASQGVQAEKPATEVIHLFKDNGRYSSARFVSVNSEAYLNTAAQETAQTLGMEPYYLYRQKNIGGNLENVGYAKPGCECLYNILIMEEMTDIIAAGAGASTKLVYHAENRVERVENCKSVDDYINRFDEMLDRKRKAF